MATYISVQPEFACLRPGCGHHVEYQHLSGCMVPGCECVEAMRTLESRHVRSPEESRRRFFQAQLIDHAPNPVCKHCGEVACQPYVAARDALNGKLPALEVPPVGGLGMLRSTA